MVTVICVHNLLFLADCSLGWARQCRWGIGRQLACRLQGWAWACARPWGCQVDTLPLHDVAGCEGAGIRHTSKTCRRCSSIPDAFDLVCVLQGCRHLAMGARQWACHLRSSGRRQVPFCLALFLSALCIASTCCRPASKLTSVVCKAVDCLLRFICCCCTHVQVCRRHSTVRRLSSHPCSRRRLCNDAVLYLLCCAAYGDRDSQM